MKKQITILFFCGFLIALVGCATAFTEANFDKLRTGMAASEVRQIFGAPNEISSSVCGGATASGQWVCETWKYKNPITDKVSDFTFSVKQDEKTLNSWNVKR
jgi:hypothetical protein